MNTLFWSIIAILILIAVSLLVLPLLKNRALVIVDGEQRNLQIARHRLAELKQQLQDGTLSDSQYQRQYQELQLALNDDIDSTPPPQPAGSGRWVIPVIVLVLPLLSLFLYLDLSDPDVLSKAAAEQQKVQNVAEVNSMIPKILERLKQNPEDLQGWLMLGRSYKYLQKFQEATSIFAKLYGFQPENVEVILNYAECLAIIHNGQLVGKPASLAYLALKIQPDNKDALWMAAVAKAEEGDNAQATVYLQKLLSLLPADAETVAQIKQMIAELESPTQPAANHGENAVSIHVKVDVAATVKAQVQPEQVLFIYAQAVSGPKMPLAIVRKQVADLPLDVVLDDSMAMQPSMHLGDFPQLKIVARISKYGNASTQSGDFIGAVELSLPANDQAVSVTINQEVK